MTVPLFYSMYSFSSCFNPFFVYLTQLFMFLLKKLNVPKNFSIYIYWNPYIHLSRKSCHLISTQHGKPLILKMWVFNGTSAVQHAGQYIIRMNVQLDFRAVNCNRNAVHLFRFQITLKFSSEMFCWENSSLPSNDIHLQKYT